jgi:DNA invertase Pin-like site-specific DNA recombinase
MKIGYARVSTTDQNPALQLDALKRAGCRQVFTDEASGSTISRPQLTKALAALKSGDVLTVWKLDRLGRSLSHLIQLTNDLTKRGIGFRSLSEAIDTTSAQGKLLLHLLGALAEFERSLIMERTRAGIAAAKQRGVRLGRRPKLSGQDVRFAMRQLERGEYSPGEIAARLRVSRATLYRALAGRNERN